MWDSIKKYSLKTPSTYMRVSNFGQNMGPKMALRLICGSTYTRVYTVIAFYSENNSEAIKHSSIMTLTMIGIRRNFFC
jgi:hypothetical protein